MKNATQIHIPKRDCNLKITQWVIFTWVVHTGKYLGIMRVFDRKRGWNLHSCQTFCFLWNKQLKEELTAEMRRKKIKLIWPINGYHERKTWQDHTLTFCKFIADVWGSINGAEEPQQCSSAGESFGQSIGLGWWSWGAAVSSLGLPLPVQLERNILN